MSYYIAIDSYGDISLKHHGIKGMRWGIRRYQNPDGSLTAAGKERYSLGTGEKTLKSGYFDKTVLTARSRNGKELRIEEIPQSAIAKGLAAISKPILRSQLNSLNFDIKLDGNKIGNMELRQDSPTEVNGVWLGINDNQRGNGYATAVLMSALHECKKNGYKTFTLEVPGNSPDARHIYEKLGFVASGQISSDDDDVWGGLTAMVLDLTKYDF